VRTYQKDNRVYRSLLVPLDGLASSEAALPIAIGIARRTGATLHLVHVQLPSNTLYVEGVQAADRAPTTARLEQARAYLEGIRAHLAAESDLTITCEVFDRPVVGAIADHALATQADLVILATHGREGLARLWLGSVTDALVRWSKAPILLQPLRSALRYAAHPQRIQRIMIPLDGSALAERILEPALALGAVMRAEFTLLHVVEPSGLVGYAPLAYVARRDKAATIQQHLEAQACLDRVAERLQAHGFMVRTQVLIAREAASAIVHTARQHGSDLIAMTTHGHSGSAGLLVGRVAVRVFHDGRFPVLLYQPQVRQGGAARDQCLPLEDLSACDIVGSPELQDWPMLVRE
jgi:nucleotide-binding universal stress UspA family protein